MSKKQFRFAEKKDVSKVLYFIHELAEYENLRHGRGNGRVDPQWLFEKKSGSDLCHGWRKRSGIRLVLP